MVRGLGQCTPHGLVLEAMGALLGRFYFYKRLEQHVATIRPDFAGRLFLRYGPHRHVCHGYHADSQIIGKAILLL
jgi:hypothetical protein